MNISQFLVTLLTLLISCVTTYALPATLDRTPERFTGTIEGSPVVAIFHGPSAPLKEDVQDKDSQDDPLAKFGPQME
ncbi:unnamed protein product [Auanema sp. JU1783]|nr:unnamed protein product [Auanema sp. JU1783]